MDEELVSTLLIVGVVGVLGYLAYKVVKNQQNNAADASSVQNQLLSQGGKGILNDIFGDA